MKTLLSKIHSGYPILFLGSGFSSEALNGLDQNLPVGNELANLIAKKLEYPENTYDLGIIAREFKENENGGGYNLFNLLKEILNVETYSENQKQIMSVPWERVYTTNYDNVVEKVYTDNKHSFASLSAPLNEPPPNNKKLTQIVHLNGRLEGAQEYKDFDSQIRLTKASYVSTDFISNHWYGKFTTDTTMCSALIIIGYSVYDLDIAKILYSDPTLKRKTFFIEPVEVDPVNRRELEQFGRVLSVGLSGFSAQIMAYVPPENAIPILIGFDEIKTKTTDLQPTGDDVRSLIFQGDYSQPKFKISQFGEVLYAIDRTVVHDVVKRIIEGYNSILISADLGNGKSVITSQIADKLLGEGYRCLELIQFNPPLENSIQSLSADVDIKTVLFVDDLFAHARTVKAIKAFDSEIIIVATTRSAVLELNDSKVEDIFGDTVIQLDVNKLDDDEIKQMVELIDQNGLWADFSNRNFADKTYQIKRSFHSEIRDVITQLFESSALTARLTEAFHSENNTDALTVIIVSLMLDIAGVTPDLTLIKTLTGLDAYAQRDLINNVFSLEFIEPKHGKIKVKSAIFGKYLLKHAISPKFLLNRIVEIIKRCDQLSSYQQDIYSTLLKSFTRFSFIDQVFKKESGSRFYKDFYDQLKTVKSLERDAQFWLQYAIAQLQLREFHGSKISFDTAYSYAKRRSQNVKTMIDNHYAKFLLESRLYEPSYGDKFKAFSKAHNLLIGQARVEKSRYYPYGVALNYKPFYENFFNSFSTSEKQTFYHSCNEMAKEAETVTESASRYYVIENCAKELNLIAVKIDANRNN